MNNNSEDLSTPIPGEGTRRVMTGLGTMQALRGEGITALILDGWVSDNR